MITQEQLKSILSYDPATGIFTWLERPNKPGKGNSSWNTQKARSQAGNLEKDGYIRITIAKKHYPAHRLAWLYTYGEFPKIGLDHLNGIRNDNRICNLGEATPSENGQNQLRATKGNVAGYLGVSFKKQTGRFGACIRHDKKDTHLGYFDTAEEAHQAYINAKRVLHPFGHL
jgi:hypothetical protein